jgi:hypothetical protein
MGRNRTHHFSVDHQLVIEVFHGENELRIMSAVGYVLFFGGGQKSSVRVGGQTDSK